MSNDLTPSKRHEIIDWIVRKRTGLHGDHRDPALEVVDPYMGAAFAITAKGMRAELEAMDDHTLLGEGVKELGVQREMEAGYQASLAQLEEEERKQELDRKLADRKEFARSGGSTPKKLVGVLEACKSLRSRGIPTAKRARQELQCRPFENGQFRVWADSDDFVHQLEISTGNEKVITGESFRTGYWPKLKSN